MKNVLASVALFALALSTPAAAFDVTRAATQSGVYFSLAFGGPQEQAAQLHYGLNFGRTPAAHDSAGRGGMLSFDFGPVSSVQALLGGLPLLPQRHAALGEAETPPPPKQAAWYDVTQWGSTQWGVVAGAGVLGYVFTRDRKQKDTPGAPPSPPSAAPASPVDVCAPGQLPVIGGGCISDVGGGFAESHHGPALDNIADASWLEDGNGHMGDLIAAGTGRQ